jgi:hypothetical protein
MAQPVAGNPSVTMARFASAVVVADWEDSGGAAFMCVVAVAHLQRGYDRLFVRATPLVWADVKFPSAVGNVVSSAAVGVMCALGAAAGGPFQSVTREVRWTLVGGGGTGVLGDGAAIHSTTAGLRSWQRLGSMRGH